MPFFNKTITVKCYLLGDTFLIHKAIEQVTVSLKSIFSLKNRNLN